MIEKYTTEASFILGRKRHRLQMVHSKFKLMFALSNDKDQRKKIAFTFAPAQCK